ncbi:unnamed protein product, partial [Mesorhabditis belari]|uniref:Raptor N-terminal CASPase-like domain-containing protein n=1 Tax=Mesorhabditis belari TaxID=2138241 RepID=A0AAF3ENJ0_9BILA
MLQRTSKYSHRYELQLLDDHLLEGGDGEDMVRIPSIEMSLAESEQLIQQKSEKLVPRYYHEARHDDEDYHEASHQTRKTSTNTERKLITTTNIIIAVALNPGIDPEVGILPTKKPFVEAGIDTKSTSPNLALDLVCENLRAAFASMTTKARIHLYKKPPINDFKQACGRIRHSAGRERVLLYYNGHGVPPPLPIPCGQIYFFDENEKSLTYMPLSIEELQVLLDAPCAYIWDTASAGTCINSFKHFAEKHFQSWEYKYFLHKERFNVARPHITSNTSLREETKMFHFSDPPNFENCIHFAACAEGERLPTDSRLPADLFTYCMTKPVFAYFECFLLTNGNRKKFNLNQMLLGDANNRQTLLGELTWILQSITDTIAWNFLPTDIFQRLFRNDPLIGGLSRNFLVAELVMRKFGCNVQSLPTLPRMSDHPLWNSFDKCLAEVISWWDCKLVRNSEENLLYGHTILRKAPSDKDLVEYEMMMVHDQTGLCFDFFDHQADAINVWLRTSCDKEPPEQFPILLQMILSARYRVRALELIARFLDFGDWAVGHVVEIGMPQYIAALLIESQRDLKPWMAFIWAKLISIDPSMKSWLLESGDKSRPNAFGYFLEMLLEEGIESRQKVPAAYIIAELLNARNSAFRRYLYDWDYMRICTDLLRPSSARQRMTGPASVPLLRVWLLIGLGRIWRENNDARWRAIRNGSHKTVLAELLNSVPENRAAACFALGCLMKNHSHTNEHATTVAHKLVDAIAKTALFDGSEMVRKEALVALQYFVIDFADTLAKHCSSLLKECNFSLEDEILAEENEEDNNCLSITDLQEKIDLNASKNSSFWTTLVNRSGWLRRRMSSGDSDSSHGTYDEPSGKIMLTIKDSMFRSRVLGQIPKLQRLLFKPPMQRAWLALLQACLDPSLKVTQLSHQLVRHVEELAFELDMWTDHRYNRIHHDSSCQSSSCEMGYRPDKTTSLTRYNRKTSCDSSLLSSVQRADSMILGRKISLDVSAIRRPTILSLSQRESNSREKSSNSRQTSNSFSSSEDGDLRGLDQGDSDSNSRSKTKSWAKRKIGMAGRMFSAQNSPIKASGLQSPPRSSIRNPGLVPLTSTPKKYSSAISDEICDYVKQKYRSPMCQSPTMSRSQNENAYRARHHIFTPKRTLQGRTGTSEFRFPTPDPRSMSPPMKVGSIFASDMEDQLAARFTRPSLYLFKNSSNNKDGISDCHHVKACPTLWAVNRMESLEKMCVEQRRGIQEILKKNDRRRNNNDMCSSRFTIRFDRKGPISAAFSELHSLIYSTNGSSVFVHEYNLGSSSTTRLRKFGIYGGNNFMEDEVTWVCPLNRQSGELLWVGSKNGTLRVWDPHCNTKKDGLTNEQPILVAAFNPLATAQEQPFDYEDASSIPAIFCWEELSGLLAVAGNAKVVRLFDAQAEKSIAEFGLSKSKMGKISCMSMNIENHQLLAIGFNNGFLHVYDKRLYPQDSLVMEVHDTRASIRDVSITDAAYLRVLDGDGHVRIYDPRKSKTAAQNIDLEINRSSLMGHSPKSTRIDLATLHPRQQVAACVFDGGKQIGVFDVVSTGARLSLCHLPQTVNSNTDLLASSSPRISSHPHLQLYAISSPDSSSLFVCGAELEKDEIK